MSSSKLKIVTVTPIAKGIFTEQLTYFSLQDIPLGAIVTVPVRKKETEALVIACQPADKLKSELKSSDFALKKILAVKNEKIFLPEFLAAAVKTADYFALSLGQTIRTVMPQAILNNLSRGYNLKEKEVKTAGLIEDGTIKQNKFILPDEEEGRISYYKSWIRESFARKQSVLVCLPGANEVEKYTEVFGSGIDNYTIPLHTGLSAKKIWSNWQRIVKEDHPLLIIITPLFLSIPRSDIKTIIIEKENSSAYKNIVRPFIDFRRLAEYLAEELGARLILGDLILRAETIFRAEQGDFARLSGLKYRSFSAAEQIILDSRNEDKGDKNVYALGDKLIKQLKQAIATREKIIIWSGRRGLSPYTVCSDCGQIVNCPDCHSPLVLHKNFLEKKYFYLCHKCGHSGVPGDKCEKCGSWRLTLLGQGLEKIEEEMAKIWPTVPIWKIESSVGSLNKRDDLVKKFYSAKGPVILLGTEAIISHLIDKVPTIICLGIDNLFSLPDFRISEKILNNLLRLRSFASKRFIIQTRNPAEKVFHFAASGNLIDFYREEIEERLKFGYPPFKILVKISREGKPDEVKQEMAKLNELLADWTPTIYPSALSENKNRLRLNLLLKLPTSRFPDYSLLTQLKALPPDFYLDIEPESIL